LAEFGLEATGFTPPGWLISAPAIRGLRRAGVHYFTTHTSVTDLRTGRKLRAVVLCHRPRGRGERAGAALMEHAPGFVARRGSTLRLGLHPDDLSVAGLREAALNGIDAALSAGVVALTYQSLMGSRTSQAGPDRQPGRRVRHSLSLDHTLPPTIPRR
jgi:predicted deacetylase